MQFCRFQSVVEMMWAKVEMDGCDFARHFYKSVFSNGGQGGHYQERTTPALHDAVVSLSKGRNKLRMLGKIRSLWCMIWGSWFVIKFTLDWNADLVANH